MITSIEKNQLFKVGDKVKILPTILAVYPDFPYVGAAGRVCTVTSHFPYRKLAT